MARDWRADRPAANRGKLRVVHVYPTYGAEHQTSSDDPMAECSCCPARELVRDAAGDPVGVVIVHREDN